MKKYFYIISILFISTILNGQNIVITNQNQIDSFNILNPGLEHIENLEIKGEEVTTLSGLKQLKTIKNLTISETNLQSLSGLENVTNNNTTQFSTSIIIQNNDVLKSLKGIENLNIWFLAITNNQKLEFCHTKSVCSFFEKHYYYYIFDNGIGCKNPFKKCNFECNLDNNSIIFHEGFEFNNEMYSDDSDIGIDGKETYELISSINEGEYSLLIRNNGHNTFEGPGNSKLYIDFEKGLDSVTIEFTYKCIGTGFCDLYLNDSEQIIVVPDPIWRAEAGDSSAYTVCLENVDLTSPYRNYNRLIFDASPVIIATGSYGACEFNLDDINVYTKNDRNVPKTELDLDILNNPVIDWLQINSNRTQGTLLIYDFLGRMLYSSNFEHSIDCTFLSPGMYILVYENCDEFRNKTFVKI